LHPSSSQLSSQLSFLQAWFFSPPIFNLGLTIHQLPQVAQAGQRKLQKYKNIFWPSCRSKLMTNIASQNFWLRSSTEALVQCDVFHRCPLMVERIIHCVTTTAELHAMQTWKECVVVYGGGKRSATPLWRGCWPLW
jgi:hypothetical protein